MKKDGRYRDILRAINHFLVFFLLMAFVITCCTMLFVTVLSSTLGITLTDENINVAAKLTFINVIALTLILTAIDMARRKLMVELPAKRITDAAERIMQGDFSVRIPNHGKAEDKFSEIAGCMNRMAEELSGIETLRCDFVANVSHEIKTPLAVIQNYSSMLTRADLDEATRVEYARIIKSAAGNLSGLITNILRLNKLENQSIIPSVSRYNLGEQLCECLLGFENAWEEKRIEIETDIEEDVAVLSDPEMMTLVWNNLFSNAIKFTPEGGKVCVRLCSDGKYASVTVEDNGCGISREVGERMFDKFYQGDTSHAEKGNGLGLTLVRRVIDLTESEITVSSEVGKGSTFTVKMRRCTDDRP